MFVIRPEASVDVVPIDETLQLAFPSDAEARLVKALRASSKLCVSLVAEENGLVVGHVAFSPVTLDPCDRALHVLGLAPLAVRPEYQRRGIGTALIERGLQTCRDLAVDAVVVLGEPEYYRRCGFRPASEYRLGNEYGAGDEFMVASLRDGALANVSATAKYGPEFAIF